MLGLSVVACGSDSASGPSPTASVAKTITFAMLPPGPFNRDLESGFTITPMSGNWTAQSYGNPGPAITFRGSAYLAAPTSAEVEITRGGLTFTFSAADLYSSVTRIPWEFTGYRGSVALFTVSGEEGNTFGHFVTTPNPRSTDAIDRLVIKLTQPTNTTCPTCGDNPMGLDNIVVN